MVSTAHVSGLVGHVGGVARAVDRRAVAGAAPTAPLDVMALAAHAYFASVTGGLCYWSHLAASWSDSCRTLAAASMPGTANAGTLGLRTLIDQIREHIRQVGEIPLQEARLLQAELEKLTTRAQGLAGDPTPDNDPKRNPRAKL